VAEFKEFEPRLKFKTRLKSWCVPLKIVLNVSRFMPARSIETVFFVDLRRGSNSSNSYSTPSVYFAVSGLT